MQALNLAPNTLSAYLSYFSLNSLRPERGEQCVNVDDRHTALRGRGKIGNFTTDSYFLCCGLLF